MDIIANWLAGLPVLPDVDEFGRPWACMARYGMTPMQQRFYAAMAGDPGRAPAAAAAPRPLLCRNGVVDDMRLYFMAEGRLCRRDISPAQDAGDLLQLCLDHNLEAVWILAETLTSDGATHDFIDQARATWEITNAQFTPGETQTDGQARATFLKAYKKKEARGRRVPGQDQGRAVYLGFAEHSYSYGFEEIKNPVVLLGAITYTEDAIGAPLRFSAQTTGKNLMKEENKSAGRLPWIAPVDLSPYPQVINSPATDLVWMRPLTAQEIEEGGALETGDKNSQYAGACTSVQLGEGEPVYKAGAEIDASKLETGVYHVRIIAGESIFDGNMLPHPTGGQADSWQWVYTVRFLIDAGYQIEIVEGYTWARAHTTLRTWAERLWKARAALKYDRVRYASEPARAAAYNAMQTIIRGAIGLLAHEPEFKDERAGSLALYRPDWNYLIIDHARVTMLYVMWKYAKQGYITFAILTDCLYYIAKQTLPGLYDRERDLGGFKRKFARPVSAKQIAALQARKGYTINELNIALLQYDRGEIELEEVA